MSTNNNDYKFQRLLEKLRHQPMTHKEIVLFLLEGTEYNNATRRYFDSCLYGTTAREGILERFCRRRLDGRWQLRSSRKRIEAPFTPLRVLTASFPTGTFRTDFWGTVKV
jgi:hypothetical protein